MYNPFGTFLFSYSTSSTMSRSSSTSTTTTTTQQQHEVTKSHWSNAPFTSGQQLREKMANSFSNPSAYASAAQSPNNGLTTANIGIQSSQVANEDLKPRAIKKVLPSNEDCQDILCVSINEKMKIEEPRKLSGNLVSPITPSSCSSFKSLSRSDSLQSVMSSPKKTAQQQAKNRRGQKLPLRSKGIDMDAFLQHALTRDLYMNPADRMFSSAAKSANRRTSGEGSQLNNGGSRPNYCSFCKNNGEDQIVYMSHPLKDSLGKNACPILRNYECPKCHESGDYAHTNRYCPLTQRRQKESKIRQHLNAKA